MILGTGFAATEFLSPMTIIGRGGQSLNEAWAGGSEAYKGITISGFPNFFMIFGPNTNLAHNSIVFMIESQVRYIMSCIHRLQVQPGVAMEVKPERLERFASQVQERLANSVWQSGCESWYLDKNGRNTVNWPGFTFTYRQQTLSADPDDFNYLHPASATGDGASSTGNAVKQGR
jgi:hypothetical protein